MNLNDLRVFVRTQLDLDESDLPDVLLNTFIQDGYDHVINLELRWPFFEATWTIDFDPAVTITPMPLDALEVDYLLDPTGRQLGWIDVRWALENFAGSTTTGNPSYWSDWSNELQVYPKPSGPMTFRAVGYRGPADWIIGGASSEVDADRRLHIPIAYYACSMGYAQQEDEVLEQTYMNRFREAVTVAHDSVMRPHTRQPKILNGTHYGGRVPPYAPYAVQILPPSPPIRDDSAIGGTP